MSTSTVNVGSGAVTIYGANAGGSSVQVINLDTANTVYLGTVANISPGDGISIPIGPLASLTMDGTEQIYAVTSGPVVVVALVPGGTSYSPGSLTITGPVTAEITGPVDVTGTVAISGTPTVDLASGATVDIGGTANVNVENATLDIVGSGGFVLPGQVQSLYSGSNITVAPNGGTWSTITGSGSIFSVTPYQSVDVSISTATGSTATGSAYCLIIQVFFSDPTNSFTIAQEFFGIPVGGNYQFSVPCVGPNMFLQVQNNGTASNITISKINLYGSFRAIQKFQWNNDNVTALASDSTINWASANGPAGTIGNWLSAGAYTPTTTTLPTAIMLPPASGSVNGFYQVVTAAFSNNPVVVDMALLTRGNVNPGTNNPGVLMNIPSAIATNPTSFTQNFPVCIPALIIKSTSATSSLQFTAVQQ